MVPIFKQPKFIIMNVPKMLTAVPPGERAIAFMEHRVNAALTIIFFPGAGERGNGTIQTLPAVENVALPRLIKTGEFGLPINVLTPQLYADAPNPIREWPLYYMRSMIDYANTITPGKVFIMGMSLGGGAVWTALNDEQCCKGILGAVAICGTATFRTADFVRKYKINVRGYHGQWDGTVGVGNTTTYITQIGDPLAEILVFTDEQHNIWEKVCDPKYPVLKLRTHNGANLIWPEASTTAKEPLNVYDNFIKLAAAGPVPPLPGKTIDHVDVVYTDGTVTTVR